MGYLAKLGPKFFNILKIAGLILAAIIILVAAFSLIGTSLSSLFKKSGNISISPQGVLSYESSAGSGSVGKYDGELGLSARNAQMSSDAAPAYDNSFSTGDDAEEFEVTQYSVLIKTRQLSEACAAVTALKVRPEVIFESAGEYNQSCNYIFKVKKDRVSEILNLVRELNPRELSENTYTIKSLVDDFTSEIDILKNKLAAVDETLEKAVSAYDDVSELAVKVRDVASLSKIIDSRINIIDRLTQERISINSRLERLGRLKAQQLDQLEYTYFNVSVVEDKFIDGIGLGDSWKAAAKELVRNVNQVAQAITINLVALLFLVLQYAIYLLILLIVVKYGWQLAKHIWQK